MNKDQVIHVAVEPEMKALLAKEAKSLELPVSSVIRMAIRQYFAPKERG